MNMKTRHCARGFTLVELLVVIAIISVLAAMLLPTLERGMTQARIMVCVNQQRQLALGMTMYLGDSQDRVPPSYNTLPDGTLVIFRNMPTTRWYYTKGAYKRPLRVGYVFPNYVDDGHLFHCPDLISTSGASPLTYSSGSGNDYGWSRTDPNTVFGSIYANSNYYALAIDDHVTRELASVPSDFRNYYNLYRTRSLHPSVERNMRFPMLWDIGSLGGGGAAVKAHDWDVCNVAYWDGSVASIPEVGMFLVTRFGSGPEAVTLGHIYGIDFVKRAQ